MKSLLFAAIVGAAFSLQADRTLNREAAERLFAPISVVGKVENLESSVVTKNALKPETVYIAGEENSVTARPFATMTIRASVPREEDAPMTAELFPADTRNYDVFLPDDEKTRTLLPITLRGDVEGAEVYLSTNRIDSLPAFVRVREPSSDVVVISVETVR